MRAVIALLCFLGRLPREVTCNLDLHTGSHGRSTFKNEPPASNVKIIPAEVDTDAIIPAEVHADADKAVKDVTSPISQPINQSINSPETVGEQIGNAIDTQTTKMANQIHNNAETASSEMHGDEKPVVYKNRDRLLSDGDLQGIKSIKCLEKMQRGDVDPECGTPKGPSVNIEKPVPQVYAEPRHTWWVGHYPHYKSDQCHGHGERFCDPDDVLNETARCKVAQELNRFARNHDVMCNVPGTGNQEKYPFFLGVAVVEKMPDLLLDQSSMNHFGEGVLAEWGLLEDRTCPNSAVIVISVDTNEVAMASSSCEFICEDRGGKGIIIRVKETLTLTGDVLEAILGGIKEFGTVLRHESPLYEEPGIGMPDKKPILSKDLTDKIDSAGMSMEELTGGYELHEAPAPKTDRKDLATYLAHREGSYALVQRAVLGTILAAAFVTLLYLCYFAYSGDVFAIYKSFQDDLTPEYVVPELIKGQPKWGYETPSYGSFRDSY